MQGPARSGRPSGPRAGRACPGGTWLWYPSRPRHGRQDPSGRAESFARSAETSSGVAGSRNASEGVGQRASASFALMMRMSGGFDMGL